MAWAAGVAVLGGVAMVVLEHGLPGLLAALVLAGLLVAALPRKK